MHLRRLFAIGALILIGGLLAACGTDDEDVEPTAESEPTVAEVIEAEPTDEATEAVIGNEEDGIADATPAATPVEAGATPAAGEDATTQATPEMDVVAPGVRDDAEATPELDAVVAEDEEATPETASPEVTEVAMTELSGTLTLDGRVQQDFTLSDEGCVGLGEWRQLAPGTQVIVRDASGTVVDIDELEGQDSGDACAWAFAVEVPAADFFSISIPMVTEVWFDQNDPAVQSGELELFVP